MTENGIEEVRLSYKRASSYKDWNHNMDATITAKMKDGSTKQAVVRYYEEDTAPPTLDAMREALMGVLNGA